MNNIITRKKSIATNRETLEEFVEYPNFPVFIGCTDQKPEKDLKANMKWMICKDSGCIQLYNLMPPEVIYSQYHSEAIGGIWEEHHKIFCKFISRNIKGDVIEIGGSNGSLANRYLNSYKKIKWTIVEPGMRKDNDNLDENINFINAFFDKDIKLDKGKSIVHSHAFEHMYEPTVFLDDIFNYLEEGGRQIFSVPNLTKYLENKYSNSINFEHTFFFTEELLEHLLSFRKFKIIEKDYFMEHSIFYAVEKDESVVSLNLQNQYEQNKTKYLNMLNYYKEIVEIINKELNSNNSNNNFLFGGHIFSQFLIYLGLNQTKIRFILDNSNEKEDKRLYGSSLKIKKPKIIKDLENPTIIVFAGQYQNEIESQFLEINKNSKLITPSNYRDY